MPNLDELFADPEPLDEDDESLWPELFELHRSLGDRPGDLVGASPEFRQAYGEWLQERGF